MPASHYANVDLDVHCDTPLDALAAALERAGLLVLDCGPDDCAGGHRATFEAEPGDRADDAVRNLCAAVRALDGEPAAIWQRARLRRFDVGLHGGDEPHLFHQVLSAQTVREVAELGASLAISLYAVAPAEDGAT